MSKNTRRRQLQKLAERRAAERRRHRRRRVIAGTVAVALVLGAGGATGLALLRGGGGPDVAESPGPAEEPPAEVACGGTVPEAAGEPKPTFDGPPDMDIDRDGEYRAVLRTSCGKVEVDLFAEQTPVTVNNFVFLAREGFYDGVVFHRVIEGFMNQTGDPQGTGAGGPGYEFEDEIVRGLRFDQPGLVAMANPGQPDMNGSQFFITVAPADHLDGQHTIFGRVVKGMTVVNRINRLATDATDRPLETVYIERVVIREG